MKSKKNSRTTTEKSTFTLLELVVVISILALASSLAVATFRGESPARQMENASLQFEAFCAKVRFNAMENGEDSVKEAADYVTVTNDEEGVAKAIELFCDLKMGEISGE